MMALLFFSLCAGTATSRFQAFGSLVCVPSWGASSEVSEKEISSIEEWYCKSAVFSLSSLCNCACQALKELAEKGMDTLDIKISVLKYTESLV
jgi:hypothetical protein